MQVKPQKNLLIINISLNKLSLCNLNSASPLEFPFQPSFISDMEVINKEELKTKLQSFFGENGVKSGPIILVMDESVYYQKDYPGSAPPSADTIQSYLDLVPFSAISFKLFRINGGFRLIVINREYYEAFKAVFEKMGFSVYSVVPGYVLGTVGAPAKFSAEACRVVYRKLDSITENSFSGSSEDSAAPGIRPHAYVKNHKTPLVIISIISILACLGAVYFTVLKPMTAPRQKISPTPVLSRKNVPSLIPTPTASASAELLDKYTVQILNGSGTPGLAASLEAKFRSLGFTDIKTGNVSKTAKTQVIFSSQITPSAKKLVTDLITPMFVSPVFKDSPDAQFDITLTTGKFTP
jgi:hypothetical protein